MASSKHTHSWDPFQFSLGYWNWLGQASTTWWTRQRGSAAIEAARRVRQDALIAHARHHSALYRDLYGGMPAAPSIEQLPPVTKRQLMAGFNAWVTDPAITRSGVDDFLRDPDLVGAQYLGRYAVWKSSGSTGEPGIFIHDTNALATYDALIAVQLGARELAAACGWKLLGSERTALVTATGSHFASIATWQRLVHNSPWLNGRVFSVMEPLHQLVADLNAYQPVFLSGYPTVLSVLADEKNAGRLTIHPARLWSGGECLPPAMHQNIERAFGCPVINEYGASECLSLAFGCRHGWLHVNSDWVILEPVTAEYAPTPPGEASFTALLTNLANHSQPIIRYDLGDSVTRNPEPCPCGSPLPAIRVDGRTDDLLVLQAGDGASVRVLPMALTTAIEETSGIHRFQIVQVGPEALLLRLDEGRTGGAAEGANSAQTALLNYLSYQGLKNVRVTLDERAPTPDAASGKLRQVIASAESRSRAGTSAPPH